MTEVKIIDAKVTFFKNNVENGKLICLPCKSLWIMYYKEFTFFVDSLVITEMATGSAMASFKNMFAGSMDGKDVKFIYYSNGLNDKNKIAELIKHIFEERDVKTNRLNFLKNLKFNLSLNYEHPYLY